MSPKWFCYSGNSRTHLSPCAGSRWGRGNARRQQRMRQGKLLIRARHAARPGAVLTAWGYFKRTNARSEAKVPDECWPRYAQPARRGMTFPTRARLHTVREIGKERWIRWWCVGQAARRAATRFKLRVAPLLNQVSTGFADRATLFAARGRYLPASAGICDFPQAVSLEQVTAIVRRSQVVLESPQKILAWRSWRGGLARHESANARQCGCRFARPARPLRSRGG